MVLSKPSGPISFQEWVIGRRIRSKQAASQPEHEPELKKMAPRSVLRLELTTDGESDEDTFKITYPRRRRHSPKPSSPPHPEKKSLSPSRSRSPPPQQLSPLSRRRRIHKVKTVRFEEMPLKSALRKSGSAASGSEDEVIEYSTETFSESTDWSDSESEEQSSEAEQTDESFMISVRKANKTKKKKAKISKSNDEPLQHVTCNYANCVKTIRNKSKASGKQKKLKETKAQDSSSSETDDPPKTKAKASNNSKSKMAKKQPVDDKTINTDSKPDGETSESNTDSGKNKNAGKGKQNANKKVHKNEKKNHTNQCIKKLQAKVEDAAETEGSEANSSKKKGRSEKKTGNGEGKPADEGDEKGKHPAKENTPIYFGNLGRPNLVEPIRAQVVQTDGLSRDPGYPPPNAYFDAENNVVNIYRGSMPNDHARSQYPPHDPAMFYQLPHLGMPFPPTQPYYHGYPHPPDHMGYNHVSTTQGMPIPPWNAPYPPHQGYPGQGLGTWGLPLDLPKTRGHSGGTKTKDGRRSSKNKDEAGINNVAPDGPKAQNGKNPYYFNRYFSGPGDTIGSKPSRAQNKEDGGKGSAHTSRSRFQSPGFPGREVDPNIWDNSPPVTKKLWDNASRSKENTWHSPEAEPQPPEAGEWAEQQQPAANGWPATEQQAWGGHGTEAPPSDNTRSGSQKTQGWPDDPTPDANANNVAPMPGTWVEESGPAAPTWADPTMAASTKGKIESW